MSEPPRKRPWFQYHLSTAIILMFVAGGMLGLNITPQPTDLYRQIMTYAEQHPGKSPQFCEAAPLFIHGWPVVACVEEGFVEEPKVLNYRWYMMGFVLDAALIVAVLIGTMLFCEWRIRRRERKK